MTNYAELQCTSHFSFLRGASSCEELFAQAAFYGIKALAITDRNSLAGIVRAHVAAKTTGVRLIVGCRLDLDDGASVLVYPTDKAAYARLCRLLTVAKGRGGHRRTFMCDWDDLRCYSKGMIGVLVAERADDQCGEWLRRTKRCFGPDAFLALTVHHRPDDAVRIDTLARMAKERYVQVVATNDVLFHIPDYRLMQDVVTCIRLKCTIDELGSRREKTSDRHLLPPEEMARRFEGYERAITNSMTIANRCRFSMDELKYVYPKEVTIPGMTPQEALEHLTWEAAKERHPEGLPNKIQRILAHELKLIRQLDYASYFLTVNSIVQFARSKGIVCQGRGSAANSSVCYFLGITNLDPSVHDLLFERFISTERNEPPDIDVDFEHQRREIVLQWIMETYGRDRAALCATLSRYRAKGAMRDVGKALGLPEDVIKALTTQVWTWSSEGIEKKHVQAINLNPEDRRLQMAINLARSLIGTPRHFSQHPGGFVINDTRLDELVPICPAAMKDRQIIEWDKDDADALGFMKVDCLALGMLSCINRCFDMLREFKGIDINLATLPQDDPATYRMIQRADTIGTFQVESRAQMNSLPTTQPRNMIELGNQVALIRPGPITGGMQHPYVLGRHGLIEITYPSPELENILKSTFGVPIFQEQVIRIAIECAGFSPGDADQLRRAMGKFKLTDSVSPLRDKLVNGMLARGYTPEFAQKMFDQLRGFGSYGFPQSHAMSFALIAYASSWIKCHHPEVFCASLLNSQPMGFYAIAQLVTDAREHGVEILPICINRSKWESTLEKSIPGKLAVRMGFNLVKGMKEQAANALVVERQVGGTYQSISDIWARGRVPAPVLRCLARADAFLPMLGLARREAYWAIKALRQKPMPLFGEMELHAHAAAAPVNPIIIKPTTEAREVVDDYRNIGLTLRKHPVHFMRAELTEEKTFTCQQAKAAQEGQWVRVAGLVLIRQKPGTAKGVMFMTIEDETGRGDLVIWPSTYEAHRRLILNTGMVAAYGKIDRRGPEATLIVHKLYDLSDRLAAIGNGVVLQIPSGRGDEGKTAGGAPDRRVAQPTLRKPRDIFIPDLHIDSIKVKARNFR